MCRSLSAGCFAIAILHAHKIVSLAIAASALRVDFAFTNFEKVHKS